MVQYLVTFSGTKTPRFPSGGDSCQLICCWESQLHQAFSFSFFNGVMDDTKVISFLHIVTIDLNL